MRGHHLHDGTGGGPDQDPRLDLADVMAKCMSSPTIPLTADSDRCIVLVAVNALLIAGRAKRLNA